MIENQNSKSLDPMPQQDENIVIRTMKGDLEKITGIPAPKPAEKPAPPPIVLPKISQEAAFEAPKMTAPPPPPQKMPPASAPMPAPMPAPAPFPEIKPPGAPPAPGKPPVLIIPPKIPPKEIPAVPAKPLFKAMPVWIKLGGIALGIILIVLAGLYGYWKFFIQSQPVVTPPPVEVPAVPTLPETPIATTTAPIKFFNKLPHKTITIDLPAKTPLALTESLKAESTISETISSVKQLKITYQGQPVPTSELFELMSIFAPAGFLDNYENEFALAYFSQKEGARPILIIKAKNGALAKTQMEAWEKTTFISDILPLFLTEKKLPAALPAFRSYLFINQPVRYVNVGIAYASLNYAIYNDYVIFTTSSAGMFVILQDLTGQTASANYLQQLEASINNFVR